MRVILFSHPNRIFSAINAVIFQTLAILAVSSHVRTMLTDPGTVRLRDLSQYSHMLEQTYVILPLLKKI
jgi:hypothetical protein